ncbi:hypothetical protein [Limnovirga soli]|uniref:hypothetical protein n=1 Tax=Limnovirga soli TaxID=2656915 RepID=UPI0014930726|nr:hypothetical protein [Limnovirga soli]
MPTFINWSISSEDKFCTAFDSGILYFCSSMHPDYPHKVFNDKRINYSLLMEALAMLSH